DPVQSPSRGPKAPEGQGPGGSPTAGGGGGGALRGGHRGGLCRGRGDLTHSGSGSGKQGRQPASRPCHARPKTASSPTEDRPEKPHSHPTNAAHCAPGDEQFQGNGGELIPEIIDAGLSRRPSLAPMPGKEVGEQRSPIAFQLL